MMYVRFPLSLRKVEDLLFEYDFDINHGRLPTTRLLPSLPQTENCRDWSDRS
jgi:hypothetical protein